MTQRDWAATTLGGEPRLLLGERKSSKKIEVHRVEVHEDLFSDFRAIADKALGELQRRDPKPYSTFASATSDDYFDVDVSDIPRRRDRRKKEEDPEAHEIASALSMVADCDDHPVMTAEELRGSDPSMYAIVFEDQDGKIGFIRNMSPSRPVRAGLRYLQYGDTLREIAPPDLAIDEDIDLVVAGDGCAVLSASAFTTLFGDVGIAFQQVPANIAAISTALRDTIPLRGDSIDALRQRCGRRVSDAKRLHHIATERADALRGLTTEELESLLRARALDSAIQDNELRLDPDTVSEFLDLVEGRLFNDDLTGEERRADSYSPRRR
jgi:hypothetical protein